MGMERELKRRMVEMLGGDDEPEVIVNKEDLLGAYAVLAKKHEFKPGDLVCWKPGMKNKKTPAYGSPTVVIRVFEAPVQDKSKSDAGSPYFNEPLDISCGTIDGDGDLLEYHYDSRRFEPYKG